MNTYHNCDLVECVEKFIRTNFVVQQHIHMHAFADINKSTLTQTHARTYPTKCANRTVSLALVASPCSKWVFAFIFHIRFFFLLTCFVFGCCSCTSSSLLSSNSKRETAKLSILKRKNREEKCWNFKQFYMNAVKLQKCVFSLSLSLCVSCVCFSSFFFLLFCCLIASQSHFSTH